MSNLAVSLQHEINNLRIEIDRLRAELAAEREAHAASIRVREAISADLARDLEDADTTAAKMRAALEPFSVAASSLDHKDAKWLDHEIQWCRSAFVQMPTVGDLRKARAALSETKGDGDE